MCELVPSMGSLCKRTLLIFLETPIICTDASLTWRMCVSMIGLDDSSQRTILNVFADVLAF